MKEFIFTWNVENISKSWHKKCDRLKSPAFIADTLYNTRWELHLYPRGYHYHDWLSLYVWKREDEVGRNFFFDYELACVSENNLTLTSYTFKQVSTLEARERAVGEAKFLERRDLYGRKRTLYVPNDTLTLRCRLWQSEGNDEFGQSFCCSRLEFERILSTEYFYPSKNRKLIFIRSNMDNQVLVSIKITSEQEGLLVDFLPFNCQQAMSPRFKVSIEGKNRNCKFTSSWTNTPKWEMWKVPFSKIGCAGSSTENNFKLTCDYSFFTVETKLVKTTTSCSFKFPEFTTNSVLSCIPSGILSDCPSLSKDLWHMYTEQILCDVEFKTERRSFFTHKAVLSARSPVFSAMFSNDMKEKMTNCVEIDDLEDGTLEQLLKFLYTDSFEETEWDEVMKLYYCADKYELKQLKILCYSYILRQIDFPKVYELLMLADRHNDPDLKWEVEEYILSHRQEIFKSPSWKQFSEEQPLLAARAMICEYDKGRGKRNRDVSKQSSCRNLINDFESLYKELLVGEITIQSATATFLVHKTILCAGSLTLREMFKSGTLTDSVSMKDFDDDTVSRLLLFLYNDSLGEIGWKGVAKLYHASVAYRIERLKIKCSCFFLEKLDDSNASSLSELAHKHQDGKLKAQAEDFISLTSKGRNAAKRTKTDPSGRIEARRSLRLSLRNTSSQNKKIKL